MHRSCHRQDHVGHEPGWSSCRTAYLSSQSEWSRQRSTLQDLRVLVARPPIRIVLVQGPAPREPSLSHSVLQVPAVPIWFVRVFAILSTFGSITTDAVIGKVPDWVDGVYRAHKHPRGDVLASTAHTKRSGLRPSTVSGWTDRVDRCGATQL